MQETSVFFPILNAPGPSTIRVRTARNSAPKSSRRKLVYDEEEPCPSISFTNSPIVPQRQPVTNILMKLLSSVFFNAVTLS